MRADGCEHVARYQNTLAATGAMALMNHLEVCDPPIDERQVLQTSYRRRLDE